MRKYRMWVVALGILAVTPGTTMAGPLSFFKPNRSKTANAEQPSKPNNQVVAESIAAALRDANMTGFDIAIEYNSGIASLIGSITTEQQKAMVSQVVSRVARVQRVDNQLVVKQPPKFLPPQPVAADEQPALRPASTEQPSANPFAPAADTKPASQVQQAAYQDDGTKTGSQIELVDNTAANTPRRQVPSVSDQQMAQRVASALQRARIKSFDIDIRFGRGTAILIGSIGNERERAMATHVVSRVKGVVMVDNRLKLIGQNANTYSPSRGAAATANQISNQQMAKRIAAALSRAKIHGYDIEIRFEHETAVLSGSVKTPQERAEVSQVVSAVPGVRMVNNRLMVGGNAAGPGIPVARRGLPLPVPPIPFPGQRNPYAGRNPYAQMQQRGLIQQVGYQPGPPPPGAGPPNAGMTGQPGIPAPPAYGHPGSGASHTVYNMPHLPNYAWPTYAAYPNSAQISYPKEYSASAWPYIGPFYPYPQIPMGWRTTTLEWNDGHWALNFRPRTEKWWWFLNPENW